jgi:hypothetical protein
MDDAIWAAYSWNFHLGEKYSIQIIVDGSIDHSKSDAAKKIIRGLKIGKGNQFENIRSKHLKRFSKAHPLGFKACSILSESTKRNLIYSDSDVLVFSKPQEMIDNLENGHPCYNQEESPPSDHHLLGALGALNYDIARKLNSGLMCFPQGCLDIEEAERIISHWDIDNQSWFTEMSLFACLLGAIPSHALNADRYIVNTRRQFFTEPDVEYEKLATRHFTSPVRHLMYMNGLPRLLKKFTRDAT